MREHGRCGSRGAERGEERHDERSRLLFSMCAWSLFSRLHDIQRGTRERWRLRWCRIRGAGLYDDGVEDIALMMHGCSDAFNSGCQALDNCRVCNSIGRCDRKRRRRKTRMVWKCIIIIVVIIVLLLLLLFIRHGDESGQEEGDDDGG